MAVEGTTFIKVGPAGWLNTEDVLWEGEGISKITCIFMSFGSYRISSFQYQYVEDGITKLSPVYGHHTGTNFTAVEFNHAGEYLVGLNGEYGYYGGKTRLTSLSFVTNVKTYGPFGNSASQEKFSFQFGPANRFGGFYGSFHNDSRRGLELSSIGVYVRPGSTSAVA